MVAGEAIIVMAKWVGKLLSIMALALGMAALSGCKGQDVEADSVRIGSVRYRLPPALSIKLDQNSGQKYVSGFRFTLPAGSSSQDGFIAVSVNRPDRFAAPFRPDSRPLPRGAITVVTAAAPEIDAAAKEAIVLLTVARNDGANQTLPVRCFWSAELSGEADGGVHRCRIVSTLDDGNVLEMIVSPKGGNVSLLGEKLTAALAIVGGFEREIE
jgi:hypothetical protein